MNKFLKNLRDKSIELKLKTVSNTLIIFMLIMGVVAGIGALMLKMSADEIADEWLPAVELVGDMDYLTSEYRMKQYAHLVSSSASDFDMYENELQELLININADIESYKATIQSDTDQKLYDAACKAWKEYVSVTGQRFYDLSRDMKLTEANALMLGDGKKEFDEFQAAFDALLELNEEGAAKSSRNADIAFWIVIGMVVIACSSAIVISVRIVKVLVIGITKPLEEIKGASEQLVRGDFNINIEYESEDELGQLAVAFASACEILRTIIVDANELLAQMAKGNFDIDSKAEEAYVGEFTDLLAGIRTTVAKLDETLVAINHSSEAVSQGSVHLAESAQSLADGATDSASAVEELTAIVENVAELASKNNENAKNAATKITVVVEEADETKSSMLKLTEAMERISDTSKEIENIIASIEDIASQTNLLSLNASIEAARAGEAGRGFAVVADQIGKLATDSAQSAVMTRDMIARSISEVAVGNRIVEETMKDIAEILQSVAEFEGVVNGTAEASHMQEGMMVQIKEAIDQIAGVTQDTSAGAEETLAVSEELSSTAVTLKEMIDRFNLKRR